MSRHLLAMLGVFSFLFGGCSQQPPHVLPSKPLAAPPEVTSEEEEDEGFHDLLFYIREHEALRDGSQRLYCRGTHKDRPLGFEIILGPNWNSASLDKKLPLVTSTGTVIFRSKGSESDAFVQTLDELYETKVGPQAMAEEVQFNAISLEGDPRDFAKGPVKIKLFFESEDEGSYAELFANIELTAHRLEVREKDEGYRLAIVKALQAH